MIKLIWQYRPIKYFFVLLMLLSASLFALDYFSFSKVLVYNANLGGSEAENFEISSYLLKKSDKTLPISASAYLVKDLDSNEVVVSKNNRKILPIASITKLMTAMIASELLLPNDTITISQRAYDTYGNTGQLRVGEEITVKDLFYPLLLSSSNDAAEALALAVGREKFMEEMNNKARQIGLTNTFFADPSGLSPANTSTVEDLAKLAGYLYDHYPLLLKLTREKEYRSGRHHWVNLNNISLMDNYLGGKNGYTEEANRTLVSIFQVPIESSSTDQINLTEKKSRLLALVLLQSNDRRNDLRRLINYLTNYASYLGGKNGFIPVIPHS